MTVSFLASMACVKTCSNAIDETVILLHPHLPSVGFSIAIGRVRHGLERGTCSCPRRATTGTTPACGPEYAISAGA